LGQKVNPHGYRVGTIIDWDSRWYANKSEYGKLLVEDYKIREILKKRLKDAGVPKIEIERYGGNKIRINLYCAKPGIAIGKGGTEVDKIKADLEKMTGKEITSLNIVEVNQPEIVAQLVAEKIAKDLEDRVAFRRATRGAIRSAMKMGAKGIKTMVSGRLNGAEIARSECYHEGTIPLQTIRADIDYGFAEADTTYGKIGVKVWIYKGEVLKGEKVKKLSDQPKTARPARGEKGDRPRRGGGFGGGNNRPRRDNRNEGGNNNAAS